jgi:CRP-like cAMP-binding protein
METYISALLFGAFSAISLPIGALIGVWTKPSRRIISAIMSFGAGALIAAIAFELVAPALERKDAGFFPLAIGLLLGCVMFVFLSRMLDQQGGFKRKRSTLLAHLKSEKKEKVIKIVKRLSKVDFLRSLPPDQVQALIPYIKVHNYPKSATVFSQDNFGDTMYIIECGKVRIDYTDEKGVVKTIATLGPNETFGEMAILWNALRTATAVAETEIITWEILKDDFDLLTSASPGLKEAVTRLAEIRKKTNNLPVAKLSDKEWEKQALKSMDEDNYRPSEAEVKIAAMEGGSSSATAIWLGTLLDGIPESLVIGASMVGTAISPALIGGLFVSNLPESISSSNLMKQGGAKVRNIVFMWSTIVVAVGVGAMLGNMFSKMLSPTAHSVFEGIAGGSMLAMAAQTMLPEAYEQNVWTVGFFTVIGFIATVFFHTLNPA